MPENDSFEFEPFKLEPEPTPPSIEDHLDVTAQILSGLNPDGRAEWVAELIDTITPEHGSLETMLQIISDRWQI